MRRASLGILLVGCVLASTVLPATARPRATHKTRPVVSGSSSVEAGKNTVPGELVVGYRRGVTRAEKANVRASVHAQLAERPTARLDVVEVDGSLRAAEAELAADPNVAFVEPNYIYRASALPNDTRFSSQWGLNNTGQSIAGSPGTPDADIDAPEAWDVTTGSDDVIVAVADTGAALNHPDLASNIWTNPGETGGGKETNGRDDDANGYVDDWQGWDFVGNDNRPTDLVGHGTHVAGIIGAQGGDALGVTGVNWNVKLMVLKVLGDKGEGSTSHVAAAFDYARANGALVVNASLGGPNFSTAVHQAVLNASDTLFVAAAGNEGKNNDVTPSYPCNSTAPNMVCVAASDQNDGFAGFSNYGATSVDLAAPGTRILNAQPAFARMLHETFEADIASTWATGGTGEAWSRALDTYGYYITDSASGNYVANADSWIATANPVNLAARENCQLSFVMRLAMETNRDLLHVEASSDGSSWSKVETYTGSSNNTWVSMTNDLSRYDGGPVYLRFRITSNSLLENDGASIDDVSIRCLSGTYAGSEYAYFSGTSMATPHVAGAAALIAAAAPNATVSSIHQAILGGADVIPAMAGKTQTGGRLNVLGALEVMVPQLVPDPDPSPVPTVPAIKPTPEPTGSATPEPTPTPTPTESTTPEPDPSPTEPIDPPVLLEHARQVSLELKRHVRLAGQVFVADGFLPCMTDVEVKIKRNGKVIKKTRTDARGAFSVKVRDRAGKYRVVVPRIETQTLSCGWAASSLRRHRHR